MDRRITRQLALRRYSRAKHYKSLASDKKFLNILQSINEHFNADRFSIFSISYDFPQKVIPKTMLADWF